MTNEPVEITNEDLLLEIGKLYIQNTYKDKMLTELSQQMEILKAKNTEAKE